MISMAVGKLGQLNDLVAVLEDLVRRHLDYDVKSEHCATVREALTCTLG